MAGKLKRRGLGRRGAPRRRGAGRHDRRSRRSAEPERLSACRFTAPDLQGECRRRAGRPAAAEGARQCARRASSTSARRRSTRLPEFDALRDSARDIKNHALANLDLYLEAYEAQGRWRPAAMCTGPRRAEDARDIILDICRKADAKTVTKGKSMITEEIGAQRLPRGERHRRRSRPISANTSSSCATSIRATSSRRPCT